MAVMIKEPEIVAGTRAGAAELLKIMKKRKPLEMRFPHFQGLP